MKRGSKASAWVLSRTRLRSWVQLGVCLLVVIAAAASLEGRAALAEVENSDRGGRAFLGVRVLKTANAGEVAWTVKLPTECRECQLVLNDYASGQNSKELFFHVWAPSSRTDIGPIQLKIAPQAVRGVLVGNTDVDLSKRGFSRTEPRADGMAYIDFQRLPDGISFDVPIQPHGASLPPDDLADVTEQYTFIETPGVYVRVAHADQQRRRGAYATGPWPALEAKAALNLEFAAREAIMALQLDRTLQQQGVTTIMLMNFDTNYPTLGPDQAHDDWPPHWHMHLYWREAPKVRKVGHFYISPDGLLTQNQSGDLLSLSGGARKNRWYARGESDETRTPAGEVLFSHTITPEGYFELTSARGTCRFEPISGGFNSGVILHCNHRSAALRVRAEDDPTSGRLQLFVDDRLTEEYRYDPDTGALLSTNNASN